MPTDLLPYYLTCKTCGWEEFIEEFQWFQKCLDHMEGSTWNHKRTINIGSTARKHTIKVKGIKGKKSITEVKLYRTLTVT